LWSEIPSLQPRFLGVHKRISGDHHFQQALREHHLAGGRSAPAYYIFANCSGLAFFLLENRRALCSRISHRKLTCLSPSAGRTLLRNENFGQLLRQRLSRYEILFAVNEESDEAMPLNTGA